MSAAVLVNHRLGESLGSAVYAGLANNLIGLAIVVVVACALGVPRRARAHLAASPRRPPVWQFLVGANGGLYVAGSAAAAASVSLSLLTMAIVLGQVAGGTLVDRIGLSPIGRRRVTPPRLLAVALAVAATAIGAEGGGAGHWVLLAGIALLGVGQAIQQAASGQVSVATGEPLAAGAINLTAGAAMLAAVAIVQAPGAPPTWSAPAIDWAGGLIAAFCTVVFVLAVTRIGVLRLMLAIVAGQALGAIVLDLTVPSAGHPVTATTVIGVVLTIAGVAVSGARWSGWTRR